MPEQKTSSSEWSIDNVLKTLRERHQEGKGASFQVFLNDDIAADDLLAVVERIVKAAKQQVKGGKIPVEIGKIHRLAKSFAMKADPEVAAAIAGLPGVKTILPGEIDDIYPKPVKKGPA